MTSESAMTSLTNFFDVAIFSVTASGVKKFFVYKGLIRNPKIRNTHLGFDQYL